MNIWNIEKSLNWKVLDSIEYYNFDVGSTLDPMHDYTQLFCQVSWANKKEKKAVAGLFCNDLHLKWLEHHHLPNETMSRSVFTRPRPVWIILHSELTRLRPNQFRYKDQITRPRPMHSMVYGGCATTSTWTRPLSCYYYFFCCNALA